MARRAAVAARPVARDAGFRTQAEAVREARLSVWGDVPFGRRGYVRSVEYVTRFQAADLVFSALVNGHLITFELDGYGRLLQGSLLVLR